MAVAMVVATVVAMVAGITGGGDEAAIPYTISALKQPFGRKL